MHDSCSALAAIAARAAGEFSSTEVKAWELRNPFPETTMGPVLEQRIEQVLNLCAPYHGDSPALLDYPDWFSVISYMHDCRYIYIQDHGRLTASMIDCDRISHPNFDLGDWYEEEMQDYVEENDAPEHSIPGFMPSPFPLGAVDVGSDTLIDDINWHTVKMFVDDLYALCDMRKDCELPYTEICGVQVDRNKYVALQRNAAAPKGRLCTVPKPIVITVHINGHPIRVLIDSGLLGDFISSNIADQLNLKREELSMPLTLQLAVQGSRSKVNMQTRVQFKYQNIREDRTFDIININSYDAILRMPFMYEHQICVGLNPARVVVSSNVIVPARVGAEARLMAQTISISDEEVRRARAQLHKYAEPLCKDASSTLLLPLRQINHTIPLIDENVVYPWRPSRWPEVFHLLLSLLNIKQCLLAFKCHASSL